MKAVDSPSAAIVREIGKGESDRSGLMLMGGLAPVQCC
jgi:hypothetical protein